VKNLPDIGHRDYIQVDLTLELLASRGASCTFTLTIYNFPVAFCILCIFLSKLGSDNKDVPKLPVGTKILITRLSVTGHRPRYTPQSR